MESNLSSIPITTADLEQFTDRANRLLLGVKWTPKLSSAPEPSTKSEGFAWRDSTVSATTETELSLMKIARTVSADSLLLSEASNHVATVMRQGLRVAMHLSKTYTKFSGLDQLIAQNTRGALADAQKTEFRAKYHTASAITVFVLAYYIVWELSQYRTEQVGSINIEPPGLPELSLQDPVRALDCVLFYHALLLEKSPVVHSDLDFTKFTLLYFRGVLDEMKMRASALQYADSYTSQHYKLAGSEFAINGFAAEITGNQVSIEYNRVELGEIVGNREAKHDARRLAGRLLCYDLASKRNPMYDLGGFSPVTMGYGEPGTGKSMLISALATMLSDYCQTIGLQFLFWPMPDTVVSTFQGGSAERMMDWMRVLKDPSKIIYAPIDDAENNLEERTRQGVSAGVREVIAVFLRNTEGAYAVNHGNMVIQLFTNLPDQIDKAVLSRIQGRSYIGGAQTKCDFLDQDHLWLKKHLALDPNFASMTPPADYSYLSDQTLLKTLSQVFEELKEPTDEVLQAIFRSVQAKHKFNEHAFYGELFFQVKQQFPLFTSRDVRNIQRAIDSRIMDFDFPEEWFTTPDLFFKKDYPTKKQMLIELMRQNMKGLSFADIRLQESIRYLDNMAKIASTGRERELKLLVEQLTLRNDAEALVSRSGEK